MEQVLKNSSPMAQQAEAAENAFQDQTSESSISDVPNIVSTRGKHRFFEMLNRLEFSNSPATCSSNRFHTSCAWLLHSNFLSGSI